MWHFLKDLPAIQHFTIFCSLLAMPVVTWIMFPSHKHTKQQQQTHKTKQQTKLTKKTPKPQPALLIAWAQISQDTDSKALKLLLSFLIHCSNRSEGRYLSNPSRPEASCQVDYSENTMCFLQKENDTLNGKERS